ncbi:unnamed protein product [Ilex paraguariensis]|uniref:Ycf20-like protein n=1 Tax=Ilex paraguariensis TaxID=185542 RepID=A0ABC8SBB1_9AQUA
MNDMWRANISLESILEETKRVVILLLRGSMSVVIHKFPHGSGTKMPSPGYPTSFELPTPRHSRLRFPTVHLAACLHKSAFSLGKKLYSQLCFLHIDQPPLVNNIKRMAWSIRSSADGNRLNSTPAGNPSSGTRLIRAIQAIRNKSITRLKELQKNLPVKLLFFLVGFYCATAFATVIGQTGDWDVVSAALAMAVVEGIGALMYGGSFPLSNKMRDLVTMFNYWKAGITLGLFLDSFKY